MVPFFRVAAPYYDADYAALRYDRDVQFYVDLAKESGGPVLEMGCGTGRVLLPTARAGVPVHGLFQPNYRYLIEANPEQTDVDRPEPATGGRVRRTFRSVPHPELQTLEVDFRWTHTDASGAKTSESSASVVLRWFTKGELENLLELEGFHITDYWGSFDKKPFGEAAPEQVIHAV